ncbi:MAG: serine/threonine protein kinase [Desulfobulbaceae bacterium]|nr:serine/threonine protein kinase [Desulfobulbaceae bacterium]
MNTFDDEEEEQPSFHSLPPHTILALVETALGRRCTNLCRSMNSYINRVFELAGEEGEGLIVKFYRPGRWPMAALADEHALLLELAAEEIPVIAPLTLKDGSTLCSHGDLHFALFPKKGGRNFDEYSLDQWLELGRLMGRVHLVGARRQAGARITMAPEHSTRTQVEYILGGGFMPPDLAASFRQLTDTLIAEITPLFAGSEKIRIHGDCHFANLIHRPGESFFLIDFDDMAMGPPVQDLWMLLPGHLEESLAEVDLFLEGYETFRDFDRRTLRLIEPLRAMRYIHYTAWCAHQVAEDGASQVSPDFGSRAYWEQEIRDLAEQLDRIRSAPQNLGNSL